MSLLAEIKNLSVGYHKKPVLENVSFHLERGTFAALLGANGSGKTTLLKTIAGILPPLSGTLLFQDKLRLGYCPQRESLDSLYLFSNFEVVCLGALGRVGAGRRIPEKEKEFARECLKRTGVDDIAQQRFSEMSGGQKQRVLIARALASKPDLMLLDEPTAGVDPAAVHALMDLLGEINRAEKVTILMVNHDLHAVSGRVREVLWIHRGRLEQGAAGEMLKRDRLEQWLEMELG
jgi:manganese/zinc/iron transport system ATP- binding protein